MDARAQTFLNEYLNSISQEKRESYTDFSADYFCADEKNANLCAELVKQGKKTATCSLKYWYEEAGEKMPSVGKLEVVTDWDGHPVCITETISVDECRFCDVGEEFAAAEGEGDLTLQWWREAHQKFFEAEAQQEGFEFHEEIMLVLERFKVVYK